MRLVSIENRDRTPGIVNRADGSRRCRLYAGSVLGDDQSNEMAPRRQEGPRHDQRQRNTEAEHEHPARTNRVFVIGSGGQPLMPCSVQRARQLIDAGRVKRRDYRPFTIHLKDHRRDDGQTPVQPTEVRCTPGARRTGIAVVIQLEHEDQVVYQEEVEHGTDMGRRLQEHKGHRRRHRGTKWCRPPRFKNRTRAPEWVAPTIESIVSNQKHRLNRLAQRSGAGSAVVQTAKFDTQKVLDPAVQGTEYQQGPLYRQHVRAYIAKQWKHRCAYCGNGDWEDATRFNLDHAASYTNWQRASNPVSDSDGHRVRRRAAARTGRPAAAAP